MRVLKSGRILIYLETMKYNVYTVSFLLLLGIILFELAFYCFSSPFQSQEIMEKIQVFDQQLKSFTADFQEVRQFAYDPEKEVLSGKVYFSKPARIRWNYLSPNKQEVVLTDKKAWIYIPNIKQVQLFNVEGKVQYESLPIGLRGPSKDFYKNYDMKISEVEAEGQGKAALFLMELIPREGSKAAVYYSSIRLWLRSEKWIPAEKIELKEVAGDTTVYQFSNIEINTEISSKLFKYDFPTDVEIVDHSKQLQK